jgi:GT2 family glycosyltransferase
MTTQELPVPTCDCKPLTRLRLSIAERPTSRVLVVIVNYRTPQLTIDCLRSLAAEHAKLPTMRIVVTDNASGDGSPTQISEAIREHGWEAWARVMPLERNGGFAFGNNAAIRPFLKTHAPPDYVVLLNSDTIVRPGAMAELTRFMDANPQVGMAGPRLDFEDGVPMPSAFRFHSTLSELEGGAQVGPLTRLLNRWRVPMPPRTVPHQADWVSGACLMVRREVFEQVGLLDEGYFMYYEETDFCMRARRAGWRCWYVPQASVVHLVGRSSGVTSSARPARRRPRYWFDSRRRYFLQNHGRVAGLLADVAWGTGLAINGLWRRLRRKPSYDPPWLLWDFLKYNFTRLSHSR